MNLAFNLKCLMTSIFVSNTVRLYISNIYVYLLKQFQIVNIYDSGS